MQIHDITKPQINEGLGDFIKSAQRQRQINKIADTSYKAWKQYEKTLLQANPDARADGMYEQALLAFVTKNLLGGQYLPNVINKQQIQALVKQLSSGGKISEAKPFAVTGAANPGAPTAAERAKLQQMIAAKTQAQQPVAAPVAKKTVAPASKTSAPITSKAFGSMVKDLSTSQPVGPKTSSTGGTTTVTPTGTVHKASATNPNIAKEPAQPVATPTAPAAPAQPVATPAQPAATPAQPAATPVAQKPVTPASLSPQQEKDLWLKLTQQAAVATTTAPGTGVKQTPVADTEKQNASPESSGDARSYVQLLNGAVPAETIRGLAEFGNQSTKNLGTLKVNSTGNPVADALLLMAGFKGI